MTADELSTALADGKTLEDLATTPKVDIQHVKYAITLIHAEDMGAHIILTSNYRRELKFNYEALEAGQKTYKGLYEKVQEWTSQENTGQTAPHNPQLVHKYSDSFWHPLANDLHTPTAIGVTWSVARDETLSSQDKLSLFREFDTVLGLHLSDNDFVLSPEEQQIIDDRNEARINKNWAESDRLRDTLLEQYGIQFKDTKGGAQWIRTLPARAPN